MTHRERKAVFLAFLIEKGIRNAYLTNLGTDIKYATWTADEAWYDMLDQSNDPGVLISGTFDWATSTEGAGFWGQLTCEFQDRFIFQHSKKLEVRS